MLRYGLRTALPTETGLLYVTGVHPKHEVHAWYSVSRARAERYRPRRVSLVRLVPLFVDMLP